MAWVEELVVLVVEYGQTVGSGGGNDSEPPVDTTSGRGGRLASHAGFRSRAAQGWQFSQFPQNARFECALLFRRTGVAMILRGTGRFFVGALDRASRSPAMASALQQQLVAVIRVRHLSRRSENSYWIWIMAFICFHRGSEAWRHPCSMGDAESAALLSHLAVERKVGAATQNPALNAFVFPYKQVRQPDPPGPFAPCAFVPRGHSRLS